MLEVAGLSVLYGKHAALVGRGACWVTPGEIVVDPRRQRRRQDHAAEGDCGAGAAASPAPALPLERHDLHGATAAPHRRGGDRAGARGPRHFRRVDRAREPSARRLRQARSRRPRARTSSACWRCSRVCKERYSQVVRTMSGGERQMVAIGRALMSAPEHPAAGRAFAWAVAVDVRRTVPRAPARARGRRRPAAGRAEREAEPRHRRPRLSDRDRPDRRPGTAAELKGDPAVQRAYLGTAEVHALPAAEA